MKDGVNDFTFLRWWETMTVVGVQFKKVICCPVINYDREVMGAWEEC